MSKYDVEVEARLTALEAKVAALDSHSHDVPAVGDADVGSRVQRLVDKLGQTVDLSEV